MIFVTLRSLDARGPVNIPVGRQSASAACRQALILERRPNRLAGMSAAAPFPSRPEVTSAVTRGAGRLLAALGYAPLAEVTLPNGRRADLMALSRRGEIFIVEVKSGLEDLRADLKWGEYGPYCDAFAFAVAPEFPRERLPAEPGLIVADGFGGAILREAPTVRSEER